MTVCIATSKPAQAAPWPHQRCLLPVCWFLMRARERTQRKHGLERTAALTGLLVFLSTSAFFTLIHYQDSWISHIHLEVRGHIPHVRYEAAVEERVQSDKETQRQHRGGIGGVGAADRSDALIDEPPGGKVAADSTRRDGERLAGPEVLGSLKQGTQVFVTFATGTMSDFAFNW